MTLLQGGGDADVRRDAAAAGRTVQVDPRLTLDCPRFVSTLEAEW